MLPYNLKQIPVVLLLFHPAFSQSSSLLSKLPMIFSAPNYETHPTPQCKMCPRHKLLCSMEHLSRKGFVGGCLLVGRRSQIKHQKPQRPGNMKDSSEAFESPRRANSREADNTGASPKLPFSHFLTMHPHVHVPLCVHLQIQTHICIYVYIHICIHTHTYIRIYYSSEEASIMNPRP